VARQFTNEPCFSDLAGTMQKKGLAAFAAKPLLKRVEKMSFHILKVATKMLFSRHV
jgi:predicted mannosyl-3-phosphoglycerate phosphatase (HAD superfamily)